MQEELERLKRDKVQLGPSPYPTYSSHYDFIMVLGREGTELELGYFRESYKGL